MANNYNNPILSINILISINNNCALKRLFFFAICHFAFLIRIIIIIIIDKVKVVCK